MTPYETSKLGRTRAGEVTSSEAADASSDSPSDPIRGCSATGAAKKMSRKNYFNNTN